MLEGSANGLVAQHLPAKQPEMVIIPAGKYFPLFLDDEPTNLDSFLMDRLPVTNEDFNHFVTENPQWAKASVKRLFADENYLKHWDDEKPFGPHPAEAAVVNVSWFAALKYCECQGKRLPTTAEWEYAAEAGRNRPDGKNEPGFYNLLLEFMSEPLPEKLPPAGTTLLNYYGVWDIHGVVFEWTYDFNSALTTGESRADTGSGNALFCGGGSLQTRDPANYAAFLRHAMRTSLKAKNTVKSLGFRCVKDLKIENSR